MAATLSFEGSVVAAPARVCPHGKLSPRLRKRDLNEARLGYKIFEKVWNQVQRSAFIGISGLFCPYGRTP
jgi:hypothetical protein